MGKGDKKTRRGKICIGSFGNTRKRKTKKNLQNKPKTEKAKPVQPSEAS